jgi:peptidyl-prolyl cis-trans isomerase D
MSSSFQKKTSGIFATAFIGLIIVSFMFTGYESMRATPDSVATVGNKSIKIREYQNEYNRQLEFYQSFFGSGNLTAQQIREFGISDNAINSLINGKLMITFAERMGLNPSDYQVREEIKQIPVFLSNDRFDIERYRQLLAANGLTPTDFESDVREQIKAQNSQIFFQNFPVSQKYLEDVVRFRSQQLQATLIQINRESLRNYVEISKADLDEFFGEEFNVNRVQAIFNDRKTMLDQQEEAKVRHLLITTEAKSEQEALAKIQDIKSRITPRNFIRLASENTEDPSGKEDGGDLGWIRADGMLVPEFEAAAFKLAKGEISEPIKTDFGYHIIYVEDRKEAKEAIFDDHREDIAKELIRRNKVDELDTLVAQVQVQAENHLRNDNWRGLETLQNRYGLQVERDISINRFDGATGNISVEQAQIKSLFDDLADKELFVFEDMNNITLAKARTLPPASQEELMASMEQDKMNLQMMLARKLQEEVVNFIRERVKVRVNTAMIR